MKKPSLKVNPDQTPLKDILGPIREWSAKVDYLSFTLRGAFILPVFDGDVMGYARECLQNALQAPESLPAVFCDLQLGKGRSGYKYSVAGDGGATLFFGSSTAAPLVELGGVACDTARRVGCLDECMTRYTDFITRVDLAIDLNTFLSPDEFLSLGRSKRHASTGGVDSKTGSTRYIGSKTSDRYLKVYRYFPPHPRAAFLRCEVSLKQELARQGATAVLLDGAPSSALEAARPFGLVGLQSLLSGQATAPISSSHNRPTDAGKLHWLVTQVKPALLDAHRAGLIDLARWLAEATAT